MHNLDDLLYTMQRLRDPKTGCPWDSQQDFHTVLPHTLEEAYEVADAIAKQDWPHVEEELGDLLFQIIFYGQIGTERRLFNTASIIDRLVTKLIRRHPHVFPDGNLRSERSSDEALTVDLSAQWQALKAQEKAKKNQQQKSILDDIPVGFPALTRALKLQKKASTVGFDWPDAQGVWEKLHEELTELAAELPTGNSTRIEEELGDVFFSLINLARHYKIDPESALRGTNTRFYQRFSKVEKQLEQQGGWQQADLASMNAAWQKAKE